MVELRTKRLLLREFKESDWESVHEYSSDRLVSKYMEWGPNSKEETINFICRVMEYPHAKPRIMYEFAVVLLETNKLIGAAGIRLLSQEQADIGYCFNKAYWGNGYAVEASHALIDFGFNELKLHRIFATCDADNQQSASVLQKSGMRKEAHFIEDKKVKGHWRNSFLFAILKKEKNGQS